MLSVVASEMSAATTIAICAIVAAAVIPSAFGFDLEKCLTEPMGMESGRIADHQISASSSFDAQSVGPQNGRIRTEKASGAWCPKAQIRNGSYEFLQINFNESRVIRAVETQGRYGNGTGREFVAAYMIDYWRPTVQKWIRYRDRGGIQLIEGNEDTITAVLRPLDPPIIASRIRIVPYSLQTRTACLRAELYGCPYADGVMAYSMSKPPAADFVDETFEATGEQGGLLGTERGLGLLHDGLVPNSPPIDPQFHQPARNSTWIGWSRNETDGIVALLFDFDAPRPLRDVELFGFGSPIDGIMIDFADEAEVGKFSRAIASDYPKELRSSAERPYSIRVPLKGNAASMVRLRIRFESEWAFLSEIRFNNENSDASGLGFGVAAAELGQLRIYYVMVAVLAVLFIVLFTALCALMATRNRRTSGSSSIEKLSSIGSPSSRSTAATSLSRTADIMKTGTLVTTLPMNGNGRPRHVIHSHSFAPQPVGILSQAANGTLFVAPCSRTSSQRILGATIPTRSCSSTLFSVGSSSTTAPLSGHQPSLLDIHFPPPPPSNTASSDAPTTPHSNSSSEGIYAEPCSTAPLLPPPQKRSSPRRPIPKPRSRDSLNRRNRTMPNRGHGATEAAYDITSPLGRRRGSENPPMGMHPPPPPPPLPHRLIPRAEIEIIETLGEGKFTATAVASWRTPRGDERRVALKRLIVADERARAALDAEARTMCRLQHEHIHPYLGSCEDFSVVSELAEGGDLRTFLSRNGESVSYVDILRYCAQIASGMAHLEKQGLVHGHLSPKCCLLDGGGNIRVAAARGPNHHALLRFSAPEAILHNIWSTRADVFSYAVTVWEIFGRCAELPLHNLTNNELIDNARHQLDNSPYAIFPQFDVDTDTEVSELASDCWTSPADSRPGFHEIHVFFTRKHISLASPLK